MLSRVAESFYWSARYIERAENTARMVRVNSHLVLDTPKGISPGWEPLITITGAQNSFYNQYKEASERNVVKYLIGDLSNPNSILSSLRIARENFRTIREVLPRSAWEKLNEWHILAREQLSAGLTKRGRDEYLDEIISGSQQINGLLSSVMNRDEAWQLMRIGRNLERADMTTRILDVQSTDLLPDPSRNYEFMRLESVQWISILKSLSAYSIYRREVDVRINRDDVLSFLLHNTMFPRSATNCLLSVKSGIEQLPKHEQPKQAVMSLIDEIAAQPVEKLDQENLHRVIDELQLGIVKIHQVLGEQYFHPSDNP